MFGHQDDLALGLEIFPGKSDVEELKGDYSAKHSWELAGGNQDWKIFLMGQIIMG